MLVELGSILRFTVHYRQFNVDIYNMLHYRVINVVSTNIMTIGHLEWFANEWADAVKSVMANSVTFIDVHADEVNGVGFLDYSYPPNVTGANAAQGLPTTTPYSIRKVRGSRLTRNGWIRLPGANENTVNGNEVSSGTRTTLNTNLTPLLVYEFYLYEGEEGNNSLGLDGIIWAGNDPGYPMGKFQSIAAVDTRSLIGSQDSRRD
jgi:hypothetical protein